MLKTKTPLLGLLVDAEYICPLKSNADPEANESFRIKLEPIVAWLTDQVQEILRI